MPYIRASHAHEAPSLRLRAMSYIMSSLISYVVIPVPSHTYGLLRNPLAVLFPRFQSGCKEVAYVPEVFHQVYVFSWSVVVGDDSEIGRLPEVEGDAFRIRAS